MARRSPRLALASVGTVVALAAGCGEPRPSSPTAADIARIDVSADHTVTVDDQGFEPRSIRVTAGDVVVLVNRGTRAHSFTAEERFDTGRLHPGDDTTMVLTEPGKIPYRDLEAPEHTATITVVARPADR